MKKEEGSGVRCVFSEYCVVKEGRKDLYGVLSESLSFD